MIENWAEELREFSKITGGDKMSLTSEIIKTLDDLVWGIAASLGGRWEFDQEYAAGREGSWNYVAELKNGDKRISFSTGHYKIDNRFIIRGVFPKDKKGQYQTSYNAKNLEITVAIDRGPEKIAHAIQSRLLPEYEAQLVIVLENIKKSDAYHAGRIETLKTIAEYFGQPTPEDDGKAIYPEMGRGIYKIEADSEGVKFEVTCGVPEALRIFEILKQK